ncbi:DUF1190 domain-containing protein [Nodosilinea nodulosa]|uniref:DUF1190 domain-containing protein n=1 Tax=Nodosilinea nodulosa TaxID=416001 RepID=UPI0004751994|nr:DUF1190 domain-containing protein [Nodosilinea nodulosa]
MAPKKTAPQSLYLRPIRRQQLQTSLVMAAMLATLLAGCGGEATQPSSSTPTSSQTDQNADDQIEGVFYETTEQCEADMAKQQQEYDVLLKAHEQGQLAQPPTAPVMKVEDCEPQMLAAMQEHDRTAPVYSSLEDCQSEGVECEPTPANAQTSGYRPAYGGTFLYPYGLPSFVYLNLGGATRSVYQPYTVYKSSNPGEVVTPYGQTVTKAQPGPVTTPRSTSQIAPPRPTGTAARGTITGRSSQGFGSTYKGTGSGGK